MPPSADASAPSTVPGEGAPPRLALRDIVKAYPGCIANDGVSLSVQPGEIHALLGENGAGKSTLVKIIYGLLKPDSGEIRLDGVVRDIAGPAQARALGVGMVFQHFSLFDALSVADNIALGLDPGALGVRGAGAGRGALAGRIRAVGERYGLAVDPRRAVHRLSAGEKQRIEVLRCLLTEPRLMILDEPTSVLTPQEAEALFTTVRRLAADGCSVLYISHKLDEVIRLCERATILRHGKVVAACDPRAPEVTARGLARLMVGAGPAGEELAGVAMRASGASGESAPVLEVDALTLPGVEPFGIALHDIRLELRAGEIAGIAGVAGNGQRELLLALSGETPAAPAAVRFDGRPIGALGPRRRRALGLGVVPEDRLGHAAAPQQPLTGNALLTGYVRLPLTRYGWLRGARIGAFCRRIAERFDVRGAARPAVTPAASLSGGNLQKFIVGREIEQQPRVLVVAQPTWGVDAAAAAAIHQALRALAAAGTAVLLISQDLDELLALSDRVGAICSGRLGPLWPCGAGATPELRERLGLAMTGSGI